MFSLVSQLSIVFFASLAAWHILQRIAAKSSLDNVGGPPRESFATGNLKQFFDWQGWSFHEQILARWGRVIKIHGLFGDKRLYVSDPLALYDILMKNQDNYEETPLFTATVSWVLQVGTESCHDIGMCTLISCGLGNHHKRQRKLLNPVFSVKHMRHMIPLFYQTTRKLQTVLASAVSSGPKEIDMLEWMSRTALELIGQSGLGVSFDSLEGESDNPYANAVKAFFPTISSFFLPILLLPYAKNIGTPAFRRFVVEHMPWKRGQVVRSIVDEMWENSKKVYEDKKAALAAGEDAVVAQVGQGKDIMSILLRANMDADGEDRLSDEELLSQMSGLVFAAMDTTSSALARTLHQLSIHPAEQEKLRAEIVAARREEGELDHDELVALPYLDAVCRETLRLFAPVPFISRTTVKDTVLPLSEPIRGQDGRELSSIAVPENTDIIIGILAINRDPLIWGPDATQWRPERWLEPLPESVTNAKIPGVYANMMTFLGGPRSCIGFKFSQLEMKVVLSLLVEVLSFAPSGDKDIQWNLGQGIQTPSIVGLDETRAQLPLKVSLASPGLGSF
ncbi:hypothetical protein PLICRDRAFT_108574 [Plicaturopsis crispa FD-325 SS-3]|nr:hypothetical protein PLICRDRAFT_108574 [Plicaturopsis crispa FD-325 SS-3]